ncbi:hypothetical protein IFR05_012124 [Cadophora sp. M221]|nr:hypothetical protein IFR05_012124 [Cadophora sp. M221]
MLSTGRAHLQDVVILNRPTPFGVTEVSFLTYAWINWISIVEELSIGDFEENDSEGQILFDRLEKQYELFKFTDIISLNSHTGESTHRTWAEDTLATDQLHDLKDISGSGPCLWDILQLVSSSDPALTTAITKMIILFVEKSTTIFLQRTTQYQREMLEICCKLMPELGPCLEVFVKWHIEPAQDTVGIISKGQVEPSAPPCRSIEIGNGLYSLIRDPDALHFKSFLHHQVQPSNIQMIDACILAQKNSSTLVQTRQISSEDGVKARIIACLSLGIDIHIPGSANCNETVLGHFLCSGQIEVLRSAWVEAGMEPRLLAVMVEEYSCFFIVEELNALRPLIHIIEHENHSEGIENSDATQPSDLFNHDLEMIRSKEYLRYFSEETQHIETYLNQHTARAQDIEVNPTMAILRPELDIALPAINGLSDDFWT